MSSADAIAKTLGFFKQGRVGVPMGAMVLDDGGPANSMMDAGSETRDAVIWLVASSTCVDITGLYRNHRRQGGQEVNLYDQVLSPPWFDSTIAYEQEDKPGVVLAHCAYVEVDDYPATDRWESLADDHTIDWAEVGWVMIVTYWLGGSGAAAGPTMSVRVAVGRDGKPQDINWHQLVSHEHVGGVADDWAGVTALVLLTISFLNCRNVTLHTPVRDRAQRRRLARANVDIVELRLHKAGKTVQGRRTDEHTPGDHGIPLTQVRGHIARYGVEGRGLLFGKHSGTFWIPPHARGSAEHGVRQTRHNITEAV